MSSCSECNAPFTKPTAKFCAKCGSKRSSATAALSSAPSSSPSSSTPQPGATTTTTRTSTPQSSTAPAAPSVVSKRVPSPPPSLNSTVAPTSEPAAEDKKLQGGLTSGSSSVSNSMLQAATSTSTTDDVELAAAAEADAAAVFATLSPDCISPEMIQTSNADTLRVWRKGTLLGRGTFGSVYLGLLPDGSFHAVKVVELGRKSGTFSSKELVSLSREASLMRRLSHKNLCNFRGAFYDAEATSICMFMEYVSGGSVSSLVKKFKPLPMEVIRSWSKQLLTGLLYLHSQRVIHRDIKGDNILVDTTCSVASEAQIKLVDFGAAKRLTDGLGQSNTVCGTAYWMAPEIVDLSGEGDGYSYKADVWSAGCTVAEMVTGKPPWPSRPNVPSAIMMIGQAVDGPTEIPTVEECSAGCVDFMKKCFIRKPEDRPTVEELLQHPWIQGTMM